MYLKEIRPVDHHEGWSLRDQDGVIMGHFPRRHFILLISSLELKRRCYTEVAVEPVLKLGVAIGRQNRLLWECLVALEGGVCRV